MNAFQQTKPGNLFAQGLAGGALGGFVYVFLLTLWDGRTVYWLVLYATPPIMVLGSIIGVIEATIIWILHSWTGMRMGAAMRVTVASVLATLIVAVVGVQLDANENKLDASLLATMSFLVPPALLIQSIFRPSELFTFGRIAVRSDGFDESFQSTSLLAIAGTLPLRFLSLGCAGLWLLYIACIPKGDPPYLPLAFVCGVPLLYLGISAFLTFRSPGKLLLLLLGIGGNIPVILGGLLSLSIYCSFPRMESLLTLTEICCAFLIAWTIFLVVRLSINTTELVPLSIVPAKQIDW